MQEKPSGKPSPWKWLRPANVNKQGQQIDVYCANDECPNLTENEERHCISDGEPRAWNQYARYVLCEDCALAAGAGPVDARGQGKSPGKPGRPKKEQPRRSMNRHDQILQALQGLTVLLTKDKELRAEEDDCPYEEESAPDESEAQPVASSKGSISEELLANWFAETAWPRIESFVHDEIERAVVEIVEQHMGGVRKQLAPLFGYEVKGPADATRLKVAFEAGYKYNNLQQQFNDLSKEVHEKLNEFAAKAKAAKSAEDMTPPNGKMQRVIEVQTP